jgi:hypothetical protein
VAPAVVFGLLALIRYGRRVREVRADEARATVAIEGRAVPVAELAVTARIPHERRFVLIELGERVRMHVVDAGTGAKARAIHRLVQSKGAKVVCVYARRVGLANLLRWLVPVLWVVTAAALIGLHAGIGRDAELGVVMAGGLASVFALIDAAGVDGPPFVVDVANRRVFYRRWVAASEVTRGAPRIGNLSTPDLVVSVQGVDVRLGEDFGPLGEVRGALDRILGES